MTKRVAIVHHIMGVYLGNCLGLGFFSAMDTAGQSQAVTFANADEAKEHIASWESHSNPEDYIFFDVQPVEGNYADATSLLLAGVPRDYVTPMINAEIEVVERLKASGMRFH